MTFTMDQAVEKANALLKLAARSISKEQMEDIVDMAYSIGKITSLRLSGHHQDGSPDKTEIAIFNTIIFLILMKAIKEQVIF